MEFIALICGNGLVAGATATILPAGELEFQPVRHARGLLGKIVQLTAAVMAMTAGHAFAQTAPVITEQPRSVTVTYQGQSVTFSVTVSGSFPFSVQWRKNGVAVDALTAKTSNFTLPTNHIQLSDVGTYDVVITNSSGSVTSSPATLTLGPFALFNRIENLQRSEDVSFLFTISGTTPKAVLLFEGFSSGDPQVFLSHDPSNVLITSNDNWGGSFELFAAFLRVNEVDIAHNISETSKDAALLAMLPPGTYHAWSIRRNLPSASTARFILYDVTGVNVSPTIITQPTSETSTAGENVIFSVVAYGTPAALAYQWIKDGSAIPGAINPNLTLPNVQSASTGSYTCMVSNSAGSATTTAATLTVYPTAWLANLSVRASMTNSQTLIAGLVVSGGTKSVLVRAAGPALGALGVSGFMVDPKLTLFKGSTKVTENDDWGPTLTFSFTAVGAFPFPAASKDAAFLVNLSDSNTVQVTGTGPGITLVEAYDTAATNTVRLVNLSARNRVGTGADILIAGFAVAGTGTQKVLIRAVGPALTAFRVTGALVDPKLELYNSNGAKISENDNWDASLATTFNSVGAFALTPGSKDAALVAILSAGNTYTVQVSGADGGTGEALIEVYEVP